MYGRYLQGDVVDGSDFLPFDDDYMFYDETLKQYILFKAAIKKFLAIDLDLIYENWSDEKSKAFLMKQSRNVYRPLLKSPYNPFNKDIVLFKVARKTQGREGIFKALLSQADWVINFDKDLLEEGISPNAIDDLKEHQLWHKGSYSYYINPEQKDVGY